MSDYDAVQKGSLKLKGVSDHTIKKKKKKKSKDRETKKVFEQISSHSKNADDEDKPHHEVRDIRTKAEIAADKAREKRKAAEIIEKASKTHKERIMEFNGQLDNLTEHFDIPKVSWTK
ncbi:protein FAM32A-like [Saccostrea echinata]|uniref:protein FAM32A-like n=1 Tax=Saccostrea echinata TaxID=191078 RepID=UPI002A7FDEC3|nr:protein FAM32A-like [Saccostrea echinata]